MSEEGKKNLVFDFIPNRQQEKVKAALDKLDQAMAKASEFVKDKEDKRQIQARREQYRKEQEARERRKRDEEAMERMRQRLRTSIAKRDMQDKPKSVKEIDLHPPLMLVAEVLLMVTTPVVLDTLFVKAKSLKML